MSGHVRGSWLILAAVALVTAPCGYLTVEKLTVSSDLSLLFPESGDAGSLLRWTRAFKGRDPAVVLVHGDRQEAVAAVADAIAEGLRHAASIVRVVDRAPPPPALRDPTLAWALAGSAARVRLAQLMTPDGMRARLEETRALLLAPAADESMREWLSRDPLRLAQVPWEASADDTGGVSAAASSALVSSNGLARLVVAQARGSPFASNDARTAVEEIEQVLAAAARPGVTTELAGGHAIAYATERLLRRDLEVSAALSIVVASLAFVVTFRRARALVAVLPPLLLGTIWTTGLAALIPGGMSGVAIAFAAVVVGVGVDTGVHVYAAVLDARRVGLAGIDAARAARAATWRPTLTAAAVAALGFGSLGLSGLRAMRQLGLLCGAGELLTAVAIVLVTPDIGAWLERGAPPAPRRTPWIEWLGRHTSTRRGAYVALAFCAAPMALLAVIGWPRAAGAIVSIRPRELPPLLAEEHVRTLFGGHPGQSIVLNIDQDEARARARADQVAEALEPLEKKGTIAGFDALAAFAPAAVTQLSRLAERDALDLPARRFLLEKQLRDVGFDLGAFGPALDAFARPSHEVVQDPAEGAGGRSWVVARHLARDNETLVATYVHLGDDPDGARLVREAVLRADPLAAVTGFDAIDRELRALLGRDLPVVGVVAFLLVAVAMRLALKSGRHALVAMATLACEVGAVGVAMRALAVRWHVYDALVLPVLFGVTIDESMFLLHAAREHSMSEALRIQGPLVAATALTTAAGFAALLACRFDGLRDLGAVGAFGVLAGLAAALVVVPAATRVLAASPEGGPPEPR
jgi:predicted RND superfamily exporter protein